MTIFHERLVKNLRYYRKLRGLSQYQLAEACCLSANYVGEIEMGKKFPSANTMEKIVDVLGIQPENLFLEAPYCNDKAPTAVVSSYASQLSEALIGYINESLSYYGGLVNNNEKKDHHLPGNNQ